MILLKLAELAKSKGKPSHWYAKVTSLANWDKTLETVKQLLRNTERAIEVIEKLGADRAWLPWYTAQIGYRTEA